MPPTEAALRALQERDQRELAKVKLLNFNSSRAAVTHCGPSSKITWEVSGTSHRRYVTLNDQPVDASGSRTVRQGRYDLWAHYKIANRHSSQSLGTVTVAYGGDERQCQQGGIPEFLVRPQVVDAIQNLVTRQRNLELRRDPTVEVERRGIVVRLALRVPTPPSPANSVTLDVRVRATLHASRGEPRVNIAELVLDPHIDLPWYADVLTFGQLASVIERDFKRQVTPQLERLLKSNLE